MHGRQYFREPAVANRFYPGEPADLRSAVERYMATDAPCQTTFGIVVPHAGYVYSGAVAGAVYGGIDVPERVVVLSPNHTGMGPPISIYPGGVWRTPLGDIVIDQALTARITASDREHIIPDTDAHQFEHGVEVQLPFIQRRNSQAKLIAMVFQPLPLTMCRKVAEHLHAILPEAGVLFICSSDMNHYETDTITKQKDRFAIDAMIAGDPIGLYHTVQNKQISMCGVIPATILLLTAMLRGRPVGVLRDYRTSGDVSGDRSHVVGYAGITISLCC